MSATDSQREGRAAGIPALSELSLTFTVKVKRGRKTIYRPHISRVNGKGSFDHPSWPFFTDEGEACAFANGWMLGYWAAKGV